MNQIPSIEGFSIEGFLGGGGMATVWRAYQHSLARCVAIKLLKPSLAATPTEIEHFYAEARHAAALQHPNIVRVYDVGRDAGSCYIVMELVEGYDVGAWLKRKGQLQPDDTLAVAESVAVALDYAWQQSRMIHCDIKPENLMVDADGTVKVTDLGVSRMLGRPSDKDASETITGTPSYMAPEQVTGETPLDCRTDIYSLGATMYRMLTGRLLFDDPDPDRVMRMQVEDQAPHVLECRADLPDRIGSLLEIMLAKSPAHRQANWRAVLGDLGRIRWHKPTITRAPPPGGCSMRPRETATTSSGSSRRIFLKLRNLRKKQDARASTNMKRTSPSSRGVTAGQAKPPLA